MRDQRNPGAPGRATSGRSSGPVTEDAAILAAVDRGCAELAVVRSRPPLRGACGGPGCRRSCRPPPITKSSN